MGAGVIKATFQLLCLPERPGTHCVGGWVGPSVGLGGCGKSPHRVSNPRSSSLQRNSYTD